MGRPGTSPGKRKPLRPGRFPIGAKDCQQPRREHDVTVLAALALADADDHALAVDVVDVQLGDLGDPQAGGISGHEDGTVLDISDGRKEPSHLVRTEDDGKGTRLLDRRDGIRDVVAAQGDTVQEPQGGTSLVVVARETRRSCTRWTR